MLKPYKKDLSALLGQLRFDKMKPVRDATLECLKAFKESPELDVTEEDLT